MDELQQEEQADRRMAARLVRAGVGIRHVRRTLRELRDHRVDLVARQVAQGMDRESAIREARVGLGDRDKLAAQMLARPELRSRARRFAWLWFVPGPLIVFLALGFVMILVLMGFFEHGASAVGLNPSGQLQLLVVRLVLLWLVPMTVGLPLLYLAARHHVPPIWPFITMVIVSVAAGYSHVFGVSQVDNINFGWPPMEVGRAIALWFIFVAAYLAFCRGQSQRPVHA